jgi:hypothetical protein
MQLDELYMFAYTSFHINNSYRETIKLKSLGRICNKAKLTYTMVNLPIWWKLE